MRYELDDFEWTTIKPLLPNKSRGVRRSGSFAVSEFIIQTHASGVGLVAKNHIV